MKNSMVKVVVTDNKPLSLYYNRIIAVCISLGTKLHK